jgi:uncharacterized membrane protein
MANVAVIRIADLTYSLLLPVFLILFFEKYSSTADFKVLKKTLLLLLKLTLYCMREKTTIECLKPRTNFGPCGRKGTVKGLSWHVKFEVKSQK